MKKYGPHGPQGPWTMGPGPQGPGPKQKQRRTKTYQENKKMYQTYQDVPDVPRRTKKTVKMFGLHKTPVVRPGVHYKICFTDFGLLVCENWYMYVYFSTCSSTLAGTLKI